jgi:hypothetical protein
MRRPYTERRGRRWTVAAGLAVVVAFLLPTAGAAAASTPSSASSGLAADAITAAPPGSYDIIATLKCQCYNGQKTIAYRRGYYIPPNTGFGHEKVLEKHNMYTPVVAFIVAGPHNSHTNGTAGQAYAYAYHFVNGKLVAQIKILAAYDTRFIGSTHRSFGIVTAYCVGYVGACPQWVNQAINASALPATASSSSQPNGAELGYSLRSH